MGIGLWIIGLFIVVLIVVMIVAVPILAPLAFLAFIIVPFFVILWTGKFFSLSPLAVALVPPGQPRSKTRLGVAWLTILAATALMAWVIGAVSMVGLSPAPLTRLVVYPPPGLDNLLMAIVFNNFTVSSFLAFGFIEIGLPAWALITFISSLFGWKRMTVYEKKRYNHRSEHPDDLAAWFLADVALMLPIIGLGFAIFIPVAVSAISPHLYTAWHMGGWSPFAKLPGMQKQIAPIDISQNGHGSFWTITDLFPLHNWSVLCNAIPAGLRDLLIGLLVVAGLNLFAMLTHGRNNGCASKEEAIALNDKLQRTYMDDRGLTSTLLEALDGAEWCYGRHIEAYVEGYRPDPPNPKIYGLDRNAIERRLAEREKEDQEYRARQASRPSSE